MTDFAHELARQRKLAGLSQSALARAAGIHPSYVSRLENATRHPTNRRVIEKLARALEAGTLDTNLLFACAGFAPPELSSIRAQDESVMLLADILADGDVPRDEKDLIAQHIRQINRRWRSRETE